MPVIDPCLIRSWTRAGDRTVRLGVPLLDEYLEFVAARCRPNTVLAVAFDLKVFFGVVPKPHVAPRRATGAASLRPD
jgi:integrase/recombinase XerD